jgi:NADH-quinone oxidoreductase subunit C
VAGRGVEEVGGHWVRLGPGDLVEVATALRDDREIDARYLNNLSAVDRHDRFEVVYHLSSLSHNHSLVLKLYVAHEDARVPSVERVWKGAGLQEREVFDLMGIRFSGHPSMKRMFLWEGFPGYPLRKDYMALPGGESPGLRAFPKENPETWGGEFRGP